MSQPEYRGGFVSNEVKKDYGWRAPLGEYNRDLQGVALEIDTANPTSIRIDVTAGFADPVIASELLKAMNASGKFYQGGTEGPNEFVFIQQGQKDHARDAIYRIMETPHMVEVVASRQAAIAEAEAVRENTRRQEDEARSAQWRAERAARDAAHEQANQIAE